MYEATGDADAASGGQGQGFDPRQAEEIFNQFFGRGGFGGFQQGGRGGGNPFGGGFDFGDQFEQEPMEDRVEKRRGFNTHKPLEVTFKEACFGTKKDVSVYVAEKCKTCSGSQYSSKRSTCSSCGGKGKITQNISGFAKIQRPCGECHGTGSIKQKCTSCNGQGYNQVYKTFETSIPAGTLDGNTLRMRGLGEPGTGGAEPGDLILDIKVKPDPKFSAIKEEKLGVKSTLDISLAKAILGGSATVLNPDDSTTIVNVPAGTQNGDFINISGKGMAKSGNHKVYFNVKIPKNLNSTQKDMIRQFASSLGETDN